MRIFGGIGETRSAHCRATDTHADFMTVRRKVIILPDGKTVLFESLPIYKKTATYLKIYCCLWRSRRDSNSRAGV